MLTPNALKERAAKLLAARGISANAVTYAGLACALAAAWLVYEGHFFWAGAVLLFSGLLDLLDGAIARLDPNRGPWGGILDSTLDRYGDGLVYLGIAFICLETGRTGLALLAGSALLGSFAISYVRARAECEIDACRVGYWERGERLVFLALALLLDNLTVALWVLGTFTHTTALYRLYYAGNPETGALARFARTPLGNLLLENRRNTRAWAVKTAVFLAVLLLWRPGF